MEDPHGHSHYAIQALNAYLVIVRPQQEVVSSQRLQLLEQGAAEQLGDELAAATECAVAAAHNLPPSRHVQQT
jgi:hypothetical protein